MQPTPLAVAYRSIIHNTDPPETDSFIAGYRYPGPDFSRLEQIPYDVVTQWDAAANRLSTCTYIENSGVRPPHGVEGCLEALNREMLPFVEGETIGGKLGMSPCSEDETLMVPTFQFHLVCTKDATEEQLSHSYKSLLFDRGALALWVTRTIFRYMQVTGEIPNGEQRIKLLSRAHGLFQIALIPRKGDEKESLLPKGFYLHRYGSVEQSPTRLH